MLEGALYNGFTLIEDATHVTFYQGDNEYTVDVVKGNFKWKAPADGKYTLFIYSGQSEYKTQCDEILLSRGVTHNGGHYKFKNIEDFMELYHKKVKEIKEDNKQ
jgi:hypothetical protein